MIGLTARQANCLRFITGYVDKTLGVSPNLGEIAQGLGLSRKSKARVCELLDALEERGHLRRMFARTRAIEVIEPIAVPRLNGEPLIFIPVHEADVADV